MLPENHNTLLEDSMALVYATCAKVRLESQISRGGDAMKFKSIGELSWGRMEDLTDLTEVAANLKEGGLVVWGYFTFMRTVEEVDHTSWRKELHLVTKKTMMFGMAGSLAELMHQAAAYCRDEHTRTATHETLERHHPLLRK